MKRSFLAPRTAAQWRVSRVYWLSIVGLFLWTAIAVSGRVPGTPPIVVGPFLLVLAVAVVNLAFRSYERMRRRRQQQDDKVQTWSGWVFVTIDLILIGAGLRLTGGLASPLWIVLFLLGTAETILTTAVEAHLILAFGVTALVLGTFPWPLRTADSAYFLEIALRVGMFYAVSSVTRRLRENSDADKREVATLRAELELSDERARLSREIHDGVGNSLAAAVMRLEVAARGLEKQKPGAPVGTGSQGTAALLKEEAGVLREVMNDVRDWTLFTRPWATSGINGGENNGLPPAMVLKSEVDRLSRRTGMSISLTGAEALDRAGSSTRLTAFRIVQEALTNAAKHASGASCAEANLNADGPWLVLTVKDDGPGFDPADVGAGIGLNSMRERAEGIGGTLRIESAPGSGTRVVATLPLG